MNKSILTALNNQWLTELSAFSDYIKHTKKSISDVQNSFQESLKVVDDDAQTKVIIAFEQLEEHSKLNSIFPHFFRLSTFVGLYFSFENKLNYLCTKIYETENTKLKVSDLSGENIIEKARRYLTLVVEINLDDLNSEWIVIKDFQKLRNSIVHNNSSVIKDKNKQLEEQDLFKVVSKYSQLQVGAFGLFYIMNDDFLLEFVGLQTKYLSRLIEKLELKYS